MVDERDLQRASLAHDNDLAKVRKNLNSILQYELAMLIDMASCDEWDVPPNRVLGLLQDVQKKVLLVKQIGRTDK